MVPLQIGREEVLAQLRANSRTVQPSERGGFVGEFITSAEFDRTEYPFEWLVEDVMVEGQPAIWGGEKKTHKTSIAIELAVALGSGAEDSRFLTRFNVPNRKRVLLMSGESGEATIQETSRRICRAHNVTMSDLWVDWGFHLPKLANDKDLKTLERVIGDHGEQVVIIDPLYLCLLAGKPEFQAQNFYHTGPLLGDVSRACLAAGATPILIHHAVKNRNPKEAYKPMELGDLSYSGVAEFARQWILLSHRSRFDPNDPLGLHRLWMNVGGSAGFHGLWGIDIVEGQRYGDSGVRRWRVTVTSAESAERERSEATSRRRENDANDRDARDEARMLEVLGRYPDGEVLTTLATAVNVSNAKGRAVLDRLVALRRAENCQVIRTNQNGSQSSRPGYRSVGGATPDLEHPIEDE